jgi:hypothetical protein
MDRKSTLRYRLHRIDRLILRLASLLSQERTLAHKILKQSMRRTIYSMHEDSYLGDLMHDAWFNNSTTIEE